MSDEPGERRRHFRGKARPGRVLPVRWRLAGGAWQTGETKNVGVGGAFIDGASGSVGAAIELELTLPSCDQPLAMNGVVRRAGTAEAPGLGIEFVEVEVDVLLELNDYFASLTGKDGE